MPSDHSVRRYRNWYSKLLRLYPKPYHKRFGEGMEQTFNDLLRERAEEKKELGGYALWIFIETTTEIIRMNIAYMTAQKKSIIGITLTAALLLFAWALPLISGGEGALVSRLSLAVLPFLFLGVITASISIIFAYTKTETENTAYRFAVCAALAAALLLFWMIPAVGVIGMDGDPADLVYFGVLAVAVIGAIVARFQPLGLSRTLFLTAIAQALAPLIALIIWQPQFTLEALGVVGLNGFFVLLFVGSALLFRRASAVAW